MNRTYREMDGSIIRGTFLQAIIHNARWYYVTTINVYEDGMIDCWELVDLDGFRRKVREGWVVTSIAEGAQVSLGLDVGIVLRRPT